LINAQSPGLQVATHRGEWVSVDKDANTIALLCGDMLETLSNGLFRSVLHRVGAIPHERYSLPFFAGADFDTVIRPITHAIRGARTPRYPPLYTGEYMLNRLVRDFPYLAGVSRDRHTLQNHAGDSPFERRRYDSFVRQTYA
jgi:isopenicillin N synthase-like dioxygenase